MTCAREHNYIVEVTGQATRYIGTEPDEAISALLAINIDRGEEGYVVAEHAAETATVMSPTVLPAYCPEESARIESEAGKARDHMERSWEDARAAFHGDGPYYLGNQDF